MGGEEGSRQADGAKRGERLGGLRSGDGQHHRRDRTRDAAQCTTRNSTGARRLCVSRLLRFSLFQLHRPGQHVKTPLRDFAITCGLRLAKGKYVLR